MLMFLEALPACIIVTVKSLSIIMIQSMRYLLNLKNFKTALIKENEIESKVYSRNNICRMALLKLLK